MFNSGNLYPEQFMTDDPRMSSQSLLPDEARIQNNQKLKVYTRPSVQTPDKNEEQIDS